jgi:anthranilate synthase/aminodeoxychorismate synthase-like glutamine amidotransferase
LNKVNVVNIRSVRILLIDNYDSFTYNLVEYLHRCGASCDVFQNDDAFLDLTTPNELLKNYDGVLLSPGPHDPNQAGKLMLLLHKIPRNLPVLGVCLGHQALGIHYGARLVPAAEPMHGKTSSLNFTVPCDLYRNISKNIKVCRYHSLTLADLPPELVETARSDDGHIMSFRHRDLPVFGVQYHPEAILTQEGIQIMENWLEILRERAANDIIV